MATRLAWLGVVLATLNGLSIQAQELLLQPAAAPMPHGSLAGVEAVADLIRAADHLQSAGAADLARQVRQQAKLLLKQESDRLVEAQSRLQQLLASLPDSQFQISAMIAEVRETSAQDLSYAIQRAAGEHPVVHVVDDWVWSVNCGCGSELIQHLSGADKSRVSIISKPHVLALDGQEAAIQVGQTVPVIQGVTLVDGHAAPVLKDQPVGIQVSLTPQLIDGETAKFDVQMERSALTSQVPIFTDPANGKTFLSPVMDSTSVRATAEVESGGTFVVALPSSAGSASSAEESPSLLLLIATPRLIERD